jgi:hypothetical protein
MAINLNKKTLSRDPVCVTINQLIESGAPARKNDRQCLGASSIGSECLRRIQFDWMVDSHFSTQTLDRFARGNFFEGVSREHFINAGFKFAPKDQGDRFENADGSFRGHCDGVLIEGPNVPGLEYPCIWEHKCLQAKGFRDIERDGLEKTYAHYCVQIWIYQAYLDLTNPALVTIVNADSCERLHFLLPFNIQRAQLWSDRAAEIIRATRVGELLPKFTDNPNDWRCVNLCGHRDRCRRYR